MSVTNASKKSLVSSDLGSATMAPSALHFAWGRNTVLSFGVSEAAEFIWLVVWFLNALVNYKVISRTGPKTERLTTILRASAHEAELGDHDFCLSRSHHPKLLREFLLFFILLVRTASVVHGMKNLSVTIEFIYYIQRYKHGLRA